MLAFRLDLSISLKMRFVISYKKVVAFLLGRTYHVSFAPRVLDVFIEARVLVCVGKRLDRRSWF